MCGFFVTASLAAEPDVESTRRLKAVSRRGPSGSSIINLRYQNYYLTFGHARLSIQDISAAGLQPFRYGNRILVFNGEIYNFKDLKARLQNYGYVFRSGSDTEVLMYMLDRYGLGCIDELIGMFAFVFFDQDTGLLYAVRDRFGVKPLYFRASESSVEFCSDLNHLKTSEKSVLVDAVAVSQFFSTGRVCGDRSIAVAFRKVLPGSVIQLQLSSGAFRPTRTRYWQPESVINGSLDFNYDEFQRRAIAAIKYRTVSDVDYGVFLSGGLDSSYVSAVLATKTEVPVNTFNLHFEGGNDESVRASAFAKRIGSRHRTAALSIAGLLSYFDKYVDAFDEPFGDSSGLAVMAISDFVKAHVDVAISADGGDELLGGYLYYPRYKLLQRNIRLINWFRPVTKLFRRRKLNTRALNWLRSGPMDPLKLYSYFYCHSELSEFLPMTEMGRVNCNADTLPQFLDLISYMPDDLLVKVDRASMYYGLEVREPLLDHALVEYTLRSNLKAKTPTEKAPFRRFLNDNFPGAFTEKTEKVGFSIPLLRFLEMVNPQELRDAVHIYVAHVDYRSKGYLEEQMNRLTTRRRGVDVQLIWRIVVFHRWLLSVPKADLSELCGK
jgi:asparagine synthase (glutamine-hydrolysing)